MAERRAATKAQRRQWDPPKIAKVAKAAEQSYRTGDSGDTQADALTAAEHFALTVLAGMAQERTRGPGVTPSITQSRLKRDRCSSDPPSMRAESPSRGSSVAAVRRGSIDHPIEQYYHWINEPLPGYLAPETALQKTMRLELGKFGPLTPVQSAQFEAHRLGPYARKYVNRMKNIRVKHTSASFLSRARWESIRSWRDDHSEYDLDWDQDVRQEVAELRNITDMWNESH
ncbi:hypothetical protein C8R45DRAFT_1156099 [Mycena sanguinolenta]|nr:hypothetical protein C8R45DRAFT_1156099 [Mycena sanguinolenta]